MFWTPEPLRMRRWRSSPNSAINEFREDGEGLCMRASPSWLAILQLVKVWRGSFLAWISVVMYSRPQEEGKASQAWEWSPSPGDPQDWKCALREGLIDRKRKKKHANLANLVLLIKRPSADGDDPGLEWLNWKLAVCSPDPIEYVLLSSCAFEILPIFMSCFLFSIQHCCWLAFIWLLIILTTLWITTKKTKQHI